MDKGRSEDDPEEEVEEAELGVDFFNILLGMGGGETVRLTLFFTFAFGGEVEFFSAL